MLPANVAEPVRSTKGATITMEWKATWCKRSSLVQKPVVRGRKAMLLEPARAPFILCNTSSHSSRPYCTFSTYSKHIFVLASILFLLVISLGIPQCVAFVDKGLADDKSKRGKLGERADLYLGHLLHRGLELRGRSFLCTIDFHGCTDTFHGDAFGQGWS